MGNIMRYALILAISVSFLTAGFAADSHARNRGAIIGTLAVGAVLGAILAPKFNVRAATVRTPKAQPVAATGGLLHSQTTEAFATSPAPVEFVRSSDE